MSENVSDESAASIKLAQFAPARRRNCYYLKDEKGHLYKKNYKYKMDMKEGYRKHWSCVTMFCKATALTQVITTQGREQEFFQGQGQKNDHNHGVDLSLLAKLTSIAKIREEALANPELKLQAAFSSLSNSVLLAGGSLGSYKATTLSRQLHRDKATLATATLATSTLATITLATTTLVTTSLATDNGKSFII